MAKLMDCPKCQFNQPEDMFCAQCGVDMIAYQKRVPSPDKKWTKKWQLQMIIAAVALFVVSQFLNFLGVRSSLLNPTVEQALSSIDMFSQPREVSAKLVSADSQALIAANEANNKEFINEDTLAEPQTLTDVQPQKRTPANDTTLASSKTMSVVVVPQDFIAALQEGGFMQTMDEKVRVAFFDPQIEQHQTWLTALKRFRTVKKGAPGTNEDVVIKTSNQARTDRFELNLRKVSGDGVAQPNYMIDLLIDSESEDQQWERPLYLANDIVVVFFGIFEDRWLSTAYPDGHFLKDFSLAGSPRAETSLLALVVEKN